MARSVATAARMARGVSMMMQLDGNRFRRARMHMFLNLVRKVPVIQNRPVRVLDLGGTKSYWDALSDLWRGENFDITIVNLGGETRDDGMFHLRPGNACNLAEYDNDSFDIVHSNSVIEHVGHWPEMKAMADEVRRLAPHYYLQTPNFWFPVEPHFRTLFWPLYPESWRAAMLMKKRRGYRGPVATLDEAMENVQTVNLLTADQLKALFPDAQICREKAFGFTKSIIALR